jgi:hypothetical protein
VEPFFYLSTGIILQFLFTSTISRYNITSSSLFIDVGIIGNLLYK